MQEALVRFSRRRFVTGLFTVHLLWAPVLYSQRGFLAFGTSLEYSLSGRPEDVSLSLPGRDGRPAIAVATAHPSALTLFVVSDSLSLAPTHTVKLPAGLRTVVSAPRSFSAEPAYIGLTEEGDQVTLMTLRGDGVVATTLSCDMRADRMVVGDIDSDRRPDILLFGRSMAGVMSVQRTPGGGLQEGALYFRDISVSDLAMTDINGDGITDVLVLDWLSNRLQVFFGISRGVFSEQVVVDLPGEPARIAVGGGESRRPLRIAVTESSGGRITMLSGDAAGYFRITGNLTVTGATRTCALVDVDGDGLLDVVCSTDHDLSVFPATSAGTFGLPVEFACGSAGSPWGVFDVDGDRRPDLVFADRADRRLTVALNARRVGVEPRTPAFLVGAYPQGVVVTDVDGDGRPDIALVNTTSSTLSVLLNRGGGRFDAQRSFSLPARPIQISTVPAHAAGTRTFVTAHPREDAIGVLGLGADIRRATNTSVPVGSRPTILRASTGAENGGLSLLIRTRSEDGETVGVSHLEQLTPRKFIERSIRPALRERVTAVAVADLRGNGEGDLVFLYAQGAMGGQALAVARNAEHDPRVDVRSPMPLPDSLDPVRWMVGSDINGDGREDLLLVHRPPRSGISVALTGAEGVPEPPFRSIGGVSPSDEQSFLVIDADGDGKQDIVCNDVLRGAVEVLYGLGDGGFERPVRLHDGARVTGLAVGALVDRRRADLVMTEGDPGTVTISFMPFRRRP